MKKIALTTSLIILAGLTPFSFAESTKSSVGYQGNDLYVDGVKIPSQYVDKEYVDLMKKQTENYIKSKKYPIGSPARETYEQKLQESKAELADYKSNNSEKLDAYKNYAEATNKAKEPVKETPATKEPVKETPTTKEPVKETPVTKEPVKETPTTKEPVKETPVTKEPVKETPVTKEPVKETPVTKEPVKETPVTKEPVKEAPTSNPNQEYEDLKAAKEKAERKSDYMQGDYYAEKELEEANKAMEDYKQKNPDKVPESDKVDVNPNQEYEDLKEAKEKAEKKSDYMQDDYYADKELEEANKALDEYKENNPDKVPESDKVDVNPNQEYEDLKAAQERAERKSDYMQDNYYADEELKEANKALEDYKKNNPDKVPESDKVDVPDRDESDMTSDDQESAYENVDSSGSEKTGDPSAVDVPDRDESDMTSDDQESAYENIDSGSPSESGSTTPSEGDSTAPSNGGSTTPSNGGSTTPSNSGSTTPSNGGSTTPSNSGSTTPSNSGSSNGKDPFSSDGPISSGGNGGGSSDPVQERMRLISSLYSVLTIFAMFLGLILMYQGAVKLKRRAENPNDARSFPSAILVTMLAGALAFNYSGSAGSMISSLLGNDNGYCFVLVDEVADSRDLHQDNCWDSSNSEAVGRLNEKVDEMSGGKSESFEENIMVIVALFQFIGLIYFLKGLYGLKLTSEGNGKDGYGKPIVTLILAALVIDLPHTLEMLQNTLALIGFGV